MADKKISQLTALSAANLAPSTDVLAIVDTSATETKKIVAQDLINGVLNVASAVGIGTASPSYKLDVAGDARSNSWIGRANGSAPTADCAVFRPADNSLGFSTANTLRVTIDSVGNLGLGVTSPTVRLDVAGSGNTTSRARFEKTGTGKILQFGADRDTTAVPYIGSESNHDFSFITNNTERGRFTAGGDLLVGTTSTAFTGRVVTLQTTSASNVITAWNSATSGDNSLIGFFTDGGTGRGSINYNRVGGTVSYNTISDYRAKDVYGLLDDSGQTIDALKVYRGKMHGATIERPMLIAHEAQEIAPYAVTGEKDAVNEDGTPKFQQIDTSSLVPLLIAEIQSLRSRVAALEAK